jgi:glycosyltransferase involved in cell wall biosynthesis
MRIAHVISRYNRGGTATWLNVLLREQRAAGHEVALLAGYVQTNELEDPGFTKLNGIRIENLGKKISLLSDLKAFIEIRKLIKELNPDVVNTHTSKAGLLGRIATYSLGKSHPAIVHTYHGHILYGYYSKPITFIFKSLEKLLSHLTDYFIISGTRVKNELQTEKVLGKTPFQLVRPGIDFANPAKNRTSEKLTIGWLGRLTKIKRPDRVVELAMNFQNIDFLIGGEGELEVDLKKSAPPNLKLLGWVRPEEFWPQCDIALLTSDNEAQPIALIEAAGYSLPLVAEDVGSVSDVLENQVSGFLTHNRNERIEAISQLSKNPQLRARMGQRASEIAHERFGAKQFLDGHIHAYEAALAAK